MAITKIKKCITVTTEQDQKIRAIQLRLMASTGKNVSYSSVLHKAITEGLKAIQ